MSERVGEPCPGVTVAQFDWQMFTHQLPVKRMQQVVVLSDTICLSISIISVSSMFLCLSLTLSFQNIYFHKYMYF